MEFKICTKCSLNKPICEFYKQKVSTKKNGIVYKIKSECKECNIKKSNERRRNNLEKQREYNKRYFKTEKGKKVRKRINDDVRARGKEKEWRKRNPEKSKLYNALHNDHTISEEEWVYCKSYFNNECAYCGLKEEDHKLMFNQQLHKEHVVHKGENDLSNCVPACKSCNCSKWKKNMEEWYLDRSYFDVNKLNKIYKWLNSDYLILRGDLNDKSTAVYK